MTALILHRTNPACNMHRFYALDVQPDLFGKWCLIREWGRISKPSQVRHISFPTEGEALTALARQRQAKERRGYTTNRQEQSTPARRATLSAGEPVRVKEPPPHPFRLS
jgi:predicted DNA-binding WGR domain protein